MAKVVLTHAEHCAGGIPSVGSPSFIHAGISSMICGRKRESASLLCNFKLRLSTHRLHLSIQLQNVGMRVQGRIFVYMSVNLL